MRILFVCTGNTCRSPMAEALVRKRIPEAEVQSAGIFAGKNQRANKYATQALKERQLDLDHHSQPVTDGLLRWADTVLTMTTQHKQALIMEFPDFQEKYYTLKEYVADSDKDIWEKLKKANADYSEKRLQFVQQNQQKMDSRRLQQKLEDHLHEEQQLIRQLEAGLINYDISDPFGGDLRVYRETLRELEHHVDKLRDKLNGDQ